jgi:cold-inducible RNA-binding protein
MGNKLYVGSLPFALTDGELKQAFQPYGNVISAKIIVDKISGRSKGFGFVEFDSEEAAGKALTAMNNSEMSGRKIMVNEAHPQKDSGGQRRNDGGGGDRNGNR